MNKVLQFGLIFLLLSCAHKSSTSSSPTGTTTGSTSELTNADEPSVAEGKASAPTLPSKSAVRPQVGDTPDTSLHPRGIDFGATIKTVAFGSSADQDLPQPIWKSIAANDPDLFLFMGDSVQVSKLEQKNPREAYKKWDTVPEYRAVREKVPFMATWDNEDYNAKEFVRYWSYVGNSTLFDQKGIYHSKIVGPKNKQVQVIMLDTRTFRVDPKDGKAGTLLGEAQWNWLEAQLKRPAQVRFVVSSIPVIAKGGADKWAMFPQERQRFFDLLKKVKAKNLLVVSGDRRQSAIAKTSLKEWGPLFDVTASPLNGPAATPEEDETYEGKPLAAESFGVAHIDWKSHHLSVQIRDASNKVVQSVSFKIR